MDEDRDLAALREKAIRIARKHHAGQLDKAGQPYIGHPIRVMNAMDTLEAKIVGVLHDAVEDSSLTLDDLRAAGFPEPIVAAIDAISKRDDEEVEAYLARVEADPLALEVKIADMKDNLDPTRIANPTEKDHRRMEKYRRILPRLEAALARHRATRPDEA